MRVKGLKGIAMILAMTTVMSICPVSVGAMSTNGDGKPIITDSNWEKPADITMDDEVGFTGWVTKDGNKYYYKDGKMKKSSWLRTNSGKYYYLRKDGKMAKGKLKLNGKLYVFSKNGVLLSDYANVYNSKGKRLTAKQASETMNTYVLENGKYFSNTHVIVTCKAKNTDAVVKYLNDNKFTVIKVESGVYKAFFPKTLNAEEVGKVIKTLNKEDIIETAERDYK